MHAQNERSSLIMQKCLGKKIKFYGIDYWTFIIYTFKVVFLCSLLAPDLKEFVMAAPAALAAEGQERRQKVEQQLKFC